MMDIDKIILSHSSLADKENLSSIESVIERLKEMSLEIHSGEILIYGKNSEMNSFVFSGTKEKDLITAIKNLKKTI